MQPRQSSSSSQWNLATLIGATSPFKVGQLVRRIFRLGVARTKGGQDGLDCDG